MYLLKLFHQSDPARPIAARMASEEVIRVGRDPASDWMIADDECEISRHHLELHMRSGRLLLKPLGANGVFGGSSAERLANGEEFPLSVGDRFRFGKYSILGDATPLASSNGADNAARTMIHAAPFGDSVAIPTEWDDAPDVQLTAGDGSLLEAFCEGAKLNSSAFSAEDPAEVMRRAGEVYRQMVIGLAALMGERTHAKAQNHIDRTTIGAKDNNPFKWAPTQRLAIDLLAARDGGFLTGATAIKASIEDLKKHLISTLAGFQSSMKALVGLTAPSAIQQAAQKQSLLQSREAASWSAYQEIHSALVRQICEGEDGPLNQAFIEAYHAKMRELTQEQER
jgi:predicted component of type VI protein secretion system